MYFTRLLTSITRYLSRQLRIEINKKPTEQESMDNISTPIVDLEQSKSQSEFDWQFHFRNFYDSESYVRVHHIGCAMTPWHDDRPCCWRNKHLPPCPKGLSSGEGVYRPSDWVVNFDDWWTIIKDGLQLLVDMGLFIYEPNPEGLISVIMDTFALEEDVVSAYVNDLSQEELEELLSKADQSIGHSAESVGMTMDEVVKLARDMGLQDYQWGFIAGPTYIEYIHDNHSPIVGKHGWSVFQQNSNDGDHLRIAQGAFINQGHLIYPFGLGSELKLWSDKW